jgi:hypothetical protein
MAGLAGCGVVVRGDLCVVADPVDGGGAGVWAHADCRAGSTTRGAEDVTGGR